MTNLSILKNNMEPPPYCCRANCTEMIKYCSQVRLGSWCWLHDLCTVDLCSNLHHGNSFIIQHWHWVRGSALNKLLYAGWAMSLINNKQNIQHDVQCKNYDYRPYIHSYYSCVYSINTQQHNNISDDRDTKWKLENIKIQIL